MTATNLILKIYGDDEVYYYPREDGKGHYICPASTLPEPELSEEELECFPDDEW
jgi:hypothetical protein